MRLTPAPRKADKVGYSPAPVLSDYLLSTQRSYYSSRIFNTQAGINPLIAAASPLFSLVCYLRGLQPSLNAETLHEDLQHEIKAFEKNAKTAHYHSETILRARYLLCAFLDEIFSSDLLLFFHQEKDDGERFFLVADKLSQDPEIHIDLLELIYLCLTLGYQGKYRLEPLGKERLAEISEKLFEGILAERGDLKKELQVLSAEKSPPPAARFHFPVWLTACFTAALLFTFYSSFSYMLGGTAEMSYQKLSQNPQN